MDRPPEVLDDLKCPVCGGSMEGLYDEYDEGFVFEGVWQCAICGMLLSEKENDEN